MIRIMGYSARLESGERISAEELSKFIHSFHGKVVFIYRRQEVQLTGIRYSSTGHELQFLLKEVGK